MIFKLSAAAVILALAVPVVAQTTATISQTPAAPCADAAKSADGTASATDCPAAQPAKLGSGIIPLAASDHDSEGEEDEGGDED